MDKHAVLGRGIMYILFELCFFPRLITFALEISDDRLVNGYSADESEIVRGT